MVKQGDIISIRGRGRLEVAEVRGTNKKRTYCCFIKTLSLKMGDLFVFFYPLLLFNHRLRPINQIFNCKQYVSR